LSASLLPKSTALAKADSKLSGVALMGGNFILKRPFWD
jgi:hypothetical protein